MDLANAVSEECEKDVVGIRPGEKMHEEMITESDSYLTYDAGKYYAILPSVIYWDREKWARVKSAVKVEEGFRYNSGTNEHFETVESLRKLIDIHVK
jgi:FlaA1/EpsC-like NDP-sugar epimerase